MLPAYEVIVVAQPLEALYPSAARLMATKDALSALTLEQHQIGKGAKIAVAKHNFAYAQLSAQVLEETLFMIMEVADAIAAHRTRGQRHEGHQAQDGEAAAGLLLRRLGIVLLIGLGIR